MPASVGSGLFAEDTDSEMMFFEFVITQLLEQLRHSLEQIGLVDTVGRLCIRQHPIEIRENSSVLTDQDLQFIVPGLGEGAEGIVKTVRELLTSEMYD